MSAFWSAAVLHNVIILLLNTEYCKGDIQIIQDPQNQTALVGQTVIFQCKYTGTLSHPRWQINGRDFTRSASLPERHSIIRQGLRVRQILESMNNSKYICFFTSRTRVESRPAFLIVRTVSDPEPITSSDPTMPPKESMATTAATVPIPMPSTVPLTAEEDPPIYEDITPTTTVSMDVSTPTSVTTVVILSAALYATAKSTNHHDSTDSIMQPTATSPLTATPRNKGSCLYQRETTTPEITPQPQVPQNEYLLLYSGIGVAVVFTPLFSITLFVVILVFCCSKRKKTLSERNIAMKPNLAYERPRQRFKMQRNEAYDHMHLPPRPESPVYCTVSALTEH